MHTPEFMAEIIDAARKVLNLYSGPSRFPLKQNYTPEEVVLIKRLSAAIAKAEGK